MKRCRVHVSRDAEMDLLDIYRYVASHDSVEKASYVLDRLESLCASLAELPLRGHVPAELDRIGVSTFREVHFKPFRVIYGVAEPEVWVHCVVDGRRDLSALLERRLLRSL